MTVTMKELIKWMLSQTEERPTEEQKALIYREVFSQDKENHNGQE